MLWYVLVVAIAYLLGGIPFGYLAGRLLKGVDIRKFGSGNVGATNVARVVSKPAGIAVFALDVAKGFLPVLLLAPGFATLAGAGSPENMQILAGLGAISGHIWTVFLKFRGGKGVATGFGVVLALAPLATLIALGAWISMVVVTRFVSLGSMTAALVLVVMLLILREDPFGSGLSLTIFAIAVASIIFWRHRSNIKRLLAGTENKIGGKKEK
jgi:glycerol-3-phosphate acyltransferase PlsY